MAYTPAQLKVIRAIRREAIRRYAKGGWTKSERHKLRSAFATSRIETNHENLEGGHADSGGWRQERRSLYDDVTNLGQSVPRYFDEADQHYRGQPPWLLAADVQRPAAQYRGRYRNARGEAINLTRKTVRGAPVGAGGRPKRGKVVTEKKVVVPGVDRSGERRALLMGYLANRDKPGALLDVAYQLPAVRDTKERSITTRRVVRGKRTKGEGAPGRVQGGGGYADTEMIVKNAVKGLEVSNFKRTPARNAIVGGSATSEHLTTDLDSYAADIPFGSGRVVAERMGIKGYRPGSYRRYIIRGRGGRRYSVQILSRVEGHWDHDHVGVDAL